MKKEIINLKNKNKLMKIKSLMIGMAACAALAACTSDGSDEPGPDPNAGTGKSYVSFRIVSANGGGRAAAGGSSRRSEDERMHSKRYPVRLQMQS